MPNAYNQFMFVLKWIIIQKFQFTKKTIARVILSLAESHIFAF